MSLKAIVCANCGAQYRIPETFKAPQAKCKKCGGTIEVNATATEAKPRTASGTAKRSSAKPKAASAERPRRATTGSRSSSSRRSSSDSSDSSRSSRRSSSGRSSSRSGSGSGRSRSRRGGEETEAKKNNTPLIAGIVGIAAVVIVVVILVMSSGDPATDETSTAKNDTTTDTTETTPDTNAADPDTTGSDTGDSTPDATGDADQAAADAAAKKAADAKAAADAAAAKPKKGKKELTSVDDIFKPKDSLAPVSYSADVSEEEQQEIEAMLVDVKDGGIAGIRAKRKLEKMGYKPIAGIVNVLRELDYTDSSDSQTAYELNKLLGVIGFGVYNASFRAQPAGEPITLEDSDWNGKTVKVWQSFHEKFGTEEGYLALKKKRAEKAKKR